MPKETIHSETPETTGLEVWDKPLKATVGWTRDVYLQVGIELPEGQHIIDRMMGNGYPLHTTRMITQLGRSAFIAMHESDVDLPDFKTSDEEDAFCFNIGCAIAQHIREAHPNWTSLFWSPTRAQVNKMIRLLRTARDQAFGKDE